MSAQNNRTFQYIYLYAAYAGLAGIWLWPTILGLGNVIPGGEQSDVWNGIWSLVFVHDEVKELRFPVFSQTINYPYGGHLWVADPIGSLIVFPMLFVVSPAQAYAILLVVQTALLGWSSHGFANDLLQAEHENPGWRPWIAGFAMSLSAQHIGSIQNGSSEAIGGGWVVLSIWIFWRIIQHKTKVRFGLPIMIVGALSSWYGALCIALFIATFALHALWRSTHHRWFPLLVGGAWSIGVLPFALLAKHFSTTSGSIVAVKNPAMLHQVRRTIGPADPLSYVMPLDFRSPDFSQLSRYGEDFIHTTYIGWVLIVLVLLYCWKGPLQRRLIPIIVAAILCFILSLGPVWVHDGQPVVFAAERVLPLPYFLLEFMWGFSSLSLLYRLGIGVSIVMALGATLLPYRKWQIMVILVLIVTEARFMAPTANYPHFTKAKASAGMQQLTKLGDGAVINHPVVGGQRYLYEQLQHGKPLASTLNFPNNTAARKVWKMLIQEANRQEKQCDRVSTMAKKTGIRYLVLHHDIKSRPDMHDKGARFAQERCSVLFADEQISIIELW